MSSRQHTSQLLIHTSMLRPELYLRICLSCMHFMTMWTIGPLRQSFSLAGTHDAIASVVQDASRRVLGSGFLACAEASCAHLQSCGGLRDPSAEALLMVALRAHTRRVPILSFAALW